MVMRSRPLRRGDIARAATVVIVALVLSVLEPTAVGAVPGCEPIRPETCSLRQLADLAGIRIGSTAEASEVVDPDYAVPLAREFTALTPENALKWYTTQPSAGAWNFSDADAVVGFARSNGMTVRGHTLVWAQNTYTPGWVRDLSDPAALEVAVEEQITTTMEHFGADIERWDVVNEPLASLGTGRSDSVFWTLGPDWIADAFILADRIDPDAELWLNEYGSDWIPGKHEALLDLVRNLVDAGVPIDGVGLQTHRLPGAVLDQERFASQLRDFTTLGLQVAITELDVPIAPTDPNGFDAQAAEYGRIVRACLSIPGCVEITVWGLSDASTWLDSLGLFPTPTRPLLFDDSFGPKPAYDAVRQALADKVAPPPIPVTVQPDADPTDPTDPTTLLPVTGSATAPLAALALVLVIGGLILNRTARRPSPRIHQSPQ